MKTLFQQIADREIPANIIYEDQFCICFHDISPQAPTHLLLVPKKHIPRIAESTAEDLELLGHLMRTIKKIAEQENLDAGFRTVINNGPDGGETVPHLHIHILAGRKLTWPPG